jgi:hypothetical protein
MLVGATVGGAVANALSVNEPLLVGCTSFGGLPALKVREASRHTFRKADTAPSSSASSAFCAALIYLLF